MFYIILCPTSFDLDGAILIETDFKGSCKWTNTLQRAAPAPVSVQDTAASNIVFVSFVFNLLKPSGFSTYHRV
jgi:hypothetical protein